MAAIRRGLARLPTELLDQTLVYILENKRHQILPGPPLQMNRSFRRVALSQLTQNATLQIHIHHATYRRFWEVSFTNGITPVLRSPERLVMIGKNALWACFRDLVGIDEMLAGVHKLYIELSCFKSLAFSIESFKDRCREVTVRASLTMDPTNTNQTGSFVFGPYMDAWTARPAICSVAWIESFVTAVRRACEQHMIQHNVRHLRERSLIQPFRPPYPPKRLTIVEMSVLEKKEEKRLEWPRLYKICAKEAAWVARG
ncbi:hypothetical protein E4T38_01058 [Aureobasidium subglaciale]|nr:hypothetical protein E4T38_01058 [Aureobasidium subglaciale]KAI5230850.1 hypothetical protein E4T40_01059 [Aureobasidium subglaciale]KAI5233771.1 hypothetical protein E4T41_01057 [Aureobasidium subglaciale]KAI5267198.1 hypothetical protein E4T46_01057 [Aureobasidium subglaciale]